MFAACKCSCWVLRSAGAGMALFVYFTSAAGVRHCSSVSSLGILPWTCREMSGIRVFWSVGDVVCGKNLETHQQKSDVGKPFYVLSCFLAENSFLKFQSWLVSTSSCKGSALTPESLDLVPELNQNACSSSLACISRGHRSGQPSPLNCISGFVVFGPFKIK